SRWPASRPAAPRWPEVAATAADPDRPRPRQGAARPRRQRRGRAPTGEGWGVPGEPAGPERHGGKQRWGEGGVREGVGVTNLADHWVPTAGYLNAASMGLPTHAVVAALQSTLHDWQAGTASPPAFDADVRASREALARLVGVDATR